MPDAVQRRTPQTGSRARYERLVHRVVEHIHAHLEDPIDLNRMAELACLSPFHWHRVYQSIQGETIHATVSRLRLQRAARELASTGQSLQAIARRAGYSAVPPFSRAFKAAYGMPPGQYRASGPHRQYDPDESSPLHLTEEVEVREQPGLKCVAVPHQGCYMEVDRAFTSLLQVLQRENALSESLVTLGVYFDDPGLVSEDRLESLACAAGVPESCFDEPLPEPLEVFEVPGGRHAVLQHRGPYDGLDAAYTWLFGAWLPDSGYAPADEPVYEIYLNNPRDTAPMDLRVQICLPLQAMDAAP